MKKEVVIVGAGPAGLATSACLNRLSIPNIILEREDCIASLWKKNAYDRLKLHLAKQFCELPHMQFPQNAPTFVPKDGFIRYLDDYVRKFKISPRFNTCVKSACFDEKNKTWNITALNATNGEIEEFNARYLVVATGENSEGKILDIKGLGGFKGELIHSCDYKSGASYKGKNVLVIGSGNSGMEIAYDLANHGANTSIVIRSPLHVMTKEMIYLGMVLVKYLPPKLVDNLLVILANLKYGDLSKYGITRPEKGPLVLKATTGRSAVIDVGTIQKIKNDEIKVFGGISSVQENKVLFEDGKLDSLDAIILATGYASTASKWVQDGNETLNKDGFPKNDFPNHWKGMNGLYCVGFARRGLDGISKDAQKVANDIKLAYNDRYISS
ncbi:hypothetical protein LUZ60_007698 [Juncus effusus]|nr:hypothetical protein LUZ60_007698 [Juncus effusus]